MNGYTYIIYKCIYMYIWVVNGGLRNYVFGPEVLTHGLGVVTGGVHVLEESVTT